MTTRDALEFSVLERISLHAPLNLERLLEMCPGHTWNQLFTAVDGLSRRGAILLRRVDRNTYLVTLGPLYADGRAASSACQPSSTASPSHS